MAIRPNFSALHLAGKLFQQFAVDAYVKIEGQRLDFIRHNQNQLRAESYEGLLDYLENAAEGRNLRAGRITILPSTFIGSPRQMHQKYQDAMAVVAKLGKPDLFLTFTCNPKWPEITDNLLPGQNASDRPDLVSRVFKMKFDALKKDLKDGVLGTLCAFVDVIEFQKRGLPHAHMLLHLENKLKLRNSEDIDSLISAQIPDPEQEPDLFDIIKANMIHRPCGALNNSCQCMKEGKCSKKQACDGWDSISLTTNLLPSIFFLSLYLSTSVFCFFLSSFRIRACLASISVQSLHFYSFLRHSIVSNSQNKVLKIKSI